jgi:hypothetical protein
LYIIERTTSAGLDQSCDVMMVYTAVLNALIQRVRRRPMTMRWGETNRKGGDTRRTPLKTKGLYYLLTIVTLGLLLGASVKWHGA